MSDRSPGRHAALTALALALSPAAMADAGWRFTHDGAFQVVPESNMFWGLAERFSPAVPYNKTSTWLEAYAKARVAYGDEHAQGLYAAASVLLTATSGSDAFAQGDTSRARIEEAYVGWRGRVVNDWTLDLSAGSKSHAIGEGMLYAVGGGNGFERGALTLAPHRAWTLAAVARLSSAEWAVDAFYLDPDELDSGDTGTRLAGARVEWRHGPVARWGTTFTRVIESTSPYPLAPIGLVFDGRDGLETWSVDAAYRPTEGRMAGWTLRGEAAVQRSERLDLEAWGVVAEIAYRWNTVRFMPKLGYSPRYFTGDDPTTPGRIERFDPLFYDGSPATWSSGGNGSMAFYNSNLWVQQVRLELVLSQSDFANVSYFDVRAAETNSPLQYGQAARLGIVDNTVAVVSGVPTRALTHEWYGEYTRVLSPNWFLTMGVAYAAPRAGLKALVPGAETWWGGLVNVSWRY